MADLKKNIDSLCRVAKRLNNGDLLQVALFLRQRIHQPDSYVVFLGESCSGKSTVINSIVGKGILPVSGIPSTGAITEVFINESAETDSFAVINRDATMELLDYPAFCDLALKPDPDVQRLRAVLPASDLGIPGVRLFDTPGYGSLIEEHDEVLIDFLPNCDAAVYTVGYRAGIQESDYEFLRKLKEMVRPGIPIYLAVNRCPSNISSTDGRIAEIHRAVTALLTDQEIPLFVLTSSQVQEGLFQSPVLNELKNRIIHDLNAPERQHELYLAFLTYLRNLATLLRADIERQIRNLEMDAEDATFMKDEMENLSAQFQYAINEIVKPGFASICTNLPMQISRSRNNIEIEVCAEIDKQSVASKDEMIAYTNTHLLPFHARKEAEDIQHYLTIELNSIDQEVNNYLNTAVINFERDIQLRFSSSALKAGVGVAKDAAGRLLNTNLLTYFAKFGGQGGAGAGMANAASHALKKVGDVFGKTFSRETHNAVKHVMKKIGLTSTKALTTAVSAILEVLTIGIEYGTWKSSLISKVKEGLNFWESQTLSLVLEDIKKLEAENIENISTIAKTYADAFAVDEEPTGDIDVLRGVLESLDELEKEIG